MLQLVLHCFTSMVSISSKPSGFRPHTVSQCIYASFQLVDSPLYSSAVGSLNLGPKAKFRQLAWRLIAIFPNLDHSAYEGSADELVYRRMELHHASISIIVQKLQELADNPFMISFGGREVLMRLLLAAIIRMRHVLCTLMKMESLSAGTEKLLKKLKKRWGRCFSKTRGGR